MTRHAAVIVGLALLSACGDNTPPLTAEVAAFPAAPRPDLDVLLLVDNTNAADYDRELAQAMQPLLTALGARPGGLPNLHVGVATSDLGTTGALDPAHPAASIGSGPGACGGSGEAGALIVAGGADVTGTFISDVAGGSGERETNYVGDLPATLQDMITGVGVSGCGFEQSLSAVGTALSNPANAGFRRAEAGLAIVLLSDEDDCSVRDAAFFDPDGSGALGPLASFRCTKQGVTCDQPLDAVGPKTGCAPAMGNAYIEDVGSLVDAVVIAEPDPTRLAVAAIVGPATPFTIEDRAMNPGDPVTAALAHSCSFASPAGGLEVADPAVRTSAWAAALGGATYSICSAGYDAVAAGIAAQLLAVVDGDPCIHVALPAGAACEVREDETPIPACPAAGPTCYLFVTDAVACAGAPDHLRVDIERTGPSSPDATVHVTCVLPTP